MKKSLVLVAVASVALASCVNDVAELAQNNEQTSLITFDTPVLYNNSVGSRADGDVTTGDGTTGDVTTGGDVAVHSSNEIDDAYPKTESFKVYGLAHEGDFSSWTVGGEGNTNELLFNGTEVSYNQGLNGWSPATPVAWPFYKKCTFAAYSPASASTSAASVAYGVNGLTITDYTNPTYGSQVDLMYTDRAYNRTTSYHVTSSYNGVPLTFKHALSSIHFALVASDAGIILKNITISGFYNKATFTEGITNNSPYTASTSWGAHGTTLAEGATQVSYTLFNDTDNDANNNIVFPQEMRRLGYLLEQKSLEHDGLLMIPQTLTSNVTLSVTYTMPAKDGQDSYDVTKNIPLDSYFSSKWEIGTRYYYILSIGSSTSQIYFAPYVEKWKTDDTVIQLQ